MDTSHVEMKSAELKKLCLTVLDTIELKRQRYRARLIQEEMNSVNNRFFHKLFRMKDWTPKQAEQHLNHPDSCVGGIPYFSLDSTVNAVYHVDWKIADQLSCAADIADVVMVSVKDLYQLLLWDKKFKEVLA